MPSLLDRLARLVRDAVAAGDLALAAALVEAAKKSAPPMPASITSLASARARRSDR